VILGQSLTVVGKRVQGRGRENPGLTHRSAPTLAQTAAFLDKRAWPAERAADRRPEALGEARAHRVKRAAQCPYVDAECDAGVPDAGSVQMSRQPKRVRAIGHCPGETLRPNTAAPSVVRVFDGYERRAGRPVGPWLNRGL